MTLSQVDTYTIEGQKKRALATQYLLHDKDSGHRFLATLNQRYFTMTLIQPHEVPYWQRQLKLEYERKGNRAK